MNGLPARQRGQIVPLFMLGVIGLVLMVVMLLNTGDFLNQRMQVNNAADAAAITQATWAARSLNTMAMNNVAFTQAFALSVLLDSLINVYKSAMRYALIKRYQYIAIIAACSADEDYRCVRDYTEKLYRLEVYAIRRLRRIARDNPGNKLKQFERIAISLSDMNKNIADSFAGFSGNMQRNLSVRNGLVFNDVIFYDDYTKIKDKNTTALPVEVAFLDGRLSHSAGTNLCDAGKRGTINGHYDTFQEHGYQPGIGPFLHGQRALNPKIKPAVDELNRNHGGKIASFISVSNIKWNVYCESHLLPNSRMRLPLYAVNTDRGEQWGLLAFARLQRTQARVMPQQFSEPVQALYGVAQATVYNTLAYDLYTQAWWAALSPAELLTADRRGAIMQRIDVFDGLPDLMSTIQNDDFGWFDAH